MTNSFVQSLQLCDSGCLSSNFRPISSKYSIPVNDGDTLFGVTTTYKLGKHVAATFNNNWRVEWYNTHIQYKLLITIQKDKSSDLNTTSRMIGVCGTLGGPTVNTCVDDMDFGTLYNPHVYNGQPRHSCNCWNQCWQ